MYGEGVRKVMAKVISVPEHIQKLKRYKPGKPIADAAKEYGISKWIKLASNENPKGVSPKAIEACKNAVSEVGHLYPHPRSPELIHKLGETFGLKEEQIICGYGADSLLCYIMMAFTEESDEILTSEGTFIGTYVNANKLGRKLTKVPLKNYAYDLEALSAAISEATKIIYLANPNNPTGTAFSKKAWEQFLEKVPSHILIVLDEAYYEYAKDFEDYPVGTDYPLDRLIVVRTFSKAYGMANFRLGYAFSNEDIIAEMIKVKLPFEPSELAAKAGTAALSDVDFLTSTQKLNQEGLAFFKSEFERLGMNFVSETRANFYMLVFKDQDDALDFSESCMRKGLILRPLAPFGILEGVRINTGTMEENRAAMKMIEEVLEERKKG